MTTQNPRTQSHGNWVDDFFEWLESLDVPKMNSFQKALVALVVTIVLVVVITTMTGHFYVVAVEFTRSLDGLSIGGLTAVVFCVLVLAEVVGVNTTMLALATGYIYGRRYSDVGRATLVASLVSFFAVCLGCVLAYVLGATCLSEWARELQRRNRIFEALDTVVGDQGLKVNLLLRLTMPDCLINFAMSCSRCSFANFVGGFIAMAPWIVAHAWYGAQIETLTDKSKVGSEQDDLITLIVGLVATTVLAFILLVYTKRVLARMVEDVEAGEAAGTAGSESGVQLSQDRRAGPMSASEREMTVPGASSPSLA